MQYHPCAFTIMEIKTGFFRYASHHINYFILSIICTTSFCLSPHSIEAAHFILSAMSLLLANNQGIISCANWFKLFKFVKSTFCNFSCGTHNCSNLSFIPERFHIPINICNKLFICLTYYRLNNVVLLFEFMDFFMEMFFHIGLLSHIFSELFNLIEYISKNSFHLLRMLRHSVDNVLIENFFSIKEHLSL